VSKAEDKYKQLMKKPGVPDSSVYDRFIEPIGNAGTNDDDNANVNTSTDTNVDPSASVNVNLAAIPIAKPKKGIRETHTTKAFYIRNDLAELINEDIKTGRRGAMTEIANALFEQYYRSLGRIK
jgi:hypothetical protein